MKDIAARFLSILIAACIFAAMLVPAAVLLTACNGPEAASAEPAPAPPMQAKTLGQHGSIWVSEIEVDGRVYIVVNQYISAQACAVAIVPKQPNTLAHRSPLCTCDCCTCAGCTCGTVDQRPKGCDCAECECEPCLCGTKSVLKPTKE